MFNLLLFLEVLQFFLLIIELIIESLDILSWIIFAFKLNYLSSFSTGWAGLAYTKRYAIKTFW